MRILCVAITLTLLASHVQAVTYQRTATLSDGSTYLYEFTADISAFSDGFIGDNEAISSVSITGGTMPDRVFTDGALNTEEISFAQPYSLGDLPTTWDILGVFNLPGFNFADFRDQSRLDATGPSEVILPFFFPNVVKRSDDTQSSAWRFVSVPEPVTAALIPLAIAPLLLRRRRQA